MLPLKRRVMGQDEPDGGFDLKEDEFMWFLQLVRSTFGSLCPEVGQQSGGGAALASQTKPRPPRPPSPGWSLESLALNHLSGLGEWGHL